MSTPFMNLNLPVVSTTLGPEWATLLNAALDIVDAHDHSSGNGAPILFSSLVIDDDLSLDDFRLIDVDAVQLNSLVAALSGASNINSVHAVNGDLYFTNGSGVPVQITNGGSVITTPTNLQQMEFDSIAGDLTIGPGDNYVFLAVDTTAPRSITLPLASSVVSGRIYVIKDESEQSEANPITVLPSGSDTIDGDASATIESDGATIFVIGNGVDGFLIL